MTKKGQIIEMTDKLSTNFSDHELDFGTLDEDNIHIDEITLQDMPVEK